jgi:hypothetical protein
VVGHITELPDGGFNLLQRVRADVNAAIDHARCGPHANAGDTGDV